MIPLQKRELNVNSVTTRGYSVIVSCCSTWPCTDARYIFQRMVAYSIVGLYTRDVRASYQYLLVASHLAVLLKD